MHGLIKERLFTPGPTPILIESQVRAVTRDIHHRTEDFRKVVRETVDLLHYYYDSKNDVLFFACSGTGAMEGAVANL